MTEKELIIYIVPTSLKNLVNSKDMRGDEWTIEFQKCY